jgi:sugar phosphate permease
VAAERAAKGKSNLLRDLVDGFTIIFRTPTAATVTIGFAGLIFVLTGYLTWMPTYLQEAFEMNSASAGWHSMFYTHFAAFFGVLIAGKLSDWVGAKGKPAWRTAMQGLGLLVAAPCIYYMGHSTSLAIVFGALAIFGFARAFFDANTYVVLYDVIPAKFHSSSSGVMIMIGFGTGALAPYILGIIKESSGLSLGFTILASIWVVCGLIMIVGGKLFYKRDILKLQNNEK